MCACVCFFFKKHQALLFFYILYSRHRGTPPKFPVLSAAFFFFFLTSQQQQYRRPCTASSALAIQVRTMWGTVSSQRCFRKDWIYYFSTLDTRHVNMPAHGVFDLVVSQMSQQFWSNIFDYTVKTLNKIKLFI